MVFNKYNTILQLHQNKTSNKKYNNPIFIAADEKYKKRKKPKPYIYGIVFTPRLS